MNGAKVERGLFAEELVNRYPLLVAKCNSLRRKIVGEDSQLALLPRALPHDVPQRKVK
jgi:hypothetical protein